MGKPWRRGGGILCPTPTEDNWIKIKTMINLNSISIVVIITTGPKTRAKGAKIKTGRIFLCMKQFKFIVVSKKRGCVVNGMTSLHCS